MRRGDLVPVALPGDFGKPRPALVIQADRFGSTGTVIVAVLTGTEVAPTLLRPLIVPTERNGLRKPSYVMIDKLTAVKRNKVGPVFGQADTEAMTTVTRAVAVLLGIV